MLILFFFLRNNFNVSIKAIGVSFLFYVFLLAYVKLYKEKYLIDVFRIFIIDIIVCLISNQSKISNFILKKLTNDKLNEPLQQQNNELCDGDICMPRKLSKIDFPSNTELNNYIQQNERIERGDNSERSENNKNIRYKEKQESNEQNENNNSIKNKSDDKSNKKNIVDEIQELDEDIIDKLKK